MDDYTYWSPLFTTPLAFFFFVGIVMLPFGLGFIGSKEKYVRPLGVLMLLGAGLSAATCWFFLEGFENRYGVESQVKSQRPIGRLVSVTRSTEKSFLIVVDGPQRVLEGHSGDLKAGEDLIEETRGNGGIAVCRTTEDAKPRCWWQVIAPNGRLTPLE